MLDSFTCAEFMKFGIFKLFSKVTPYLDNASIFLSLKLNAKFLE